MVQPEEDRCQQRRAERALTILETGEYETWPADLLGDMVKKTMITSVSRTKVKISTQFCPSARAASQDCKSKSHRAPRSVAEPPD